MNQAPYRSMEITPVPKLSLLERLFVSPNKMSHALGFVLIVPWMVGRVFSKVFYWFRNIDWFSPGKKSGVKKLFLMSLLSTVNYIVISEYFIREDATLAKIISFLALLTETAIGMFGWFFLTDTREDIIASAERKLK
jgi:hypothetical protein